MLCSHSYIQAATVVHTVSHGDFLQPDFDRPEFRHSHPTPAGERRAAGVVQTWLPDHHASSGQRGTGKSSKNVDNAIYFNTNTILKLLFSTLILLLSGQ